MSGEVNNIRDSGNSLRAPGFGSHVRGLMTERRGRTSPAPSWRSVPLLSVLVIALVSAPAFAEQGKRNKGVIGNAGDAVTQPLNDLNFRSDDIPVELLMIQDEPYALGGLYDCSALQREITKLEDVLGPDADEPQQQSGVVSKALKTGGSFLGGFIPFRGAVRELSGANAARRRMDRAVYAGVARRGFLKGFAEARQCKTAEALAIEAAEIKLGLREAPVETEFTPAPAPDLTPPVLQADSIFEIDLPPSETFGAADVVPDN